MQKKNNAHLHVTIDSDVLEDFKDAVLTKHKKAHYGALGYEVERAIKAQTKIIRAELDGVRVDLLMKTKAEHDTWQQIVAKSKPIAKMESKYHSVVAYLQKEYGIKLDIEKERVALVVEKTWRTTITAVCGADERTFAKWTHLFQQFGWLKIDDSPGFGLPPRYLVAAKGYRLTELDLAELQARVREENARFEKYGIKPTA